MNTQIFCFNRLRPVWASRVLAVLMLLASRPSVAGSDWVNDWFNQESTTTPGHFATEQRGYYTAGSFDARWRMSNDYLLSVSPPKIKVGCAGIDLFGGSMSYLNADYLVQKLQRIIQAAPGFAFELAMQEYCKSCEAVMNTLDQVTNELNQLQLNDCQASQKLATAIVHPSTISSDLQGVEAGAQGLANGLLQNWNDLQSQISASGGNSPVPMNQALSGCPTVFTQVFANGSIVQNAAQLVGLDQYAAVMRGLVGDVTVTYNSGTQAYSTTTMEPCPGNNQLTVIDFLSGTVDQKSAAGSCTSSGMTSVQSIVQSKLDSITQKITSGSAVFTSDEIAFMDSSPLPVFAILRNAASSGLSSDMEQLLLTPLSYAYSQRILDDLYKAITLVLAKANEVQSVGQQPASGQPQNSCDVSFLTNSGVADRLRQMHEMSLKYRMMAQENYHKSQAELVASLQSAKQFYEMRVRSLNANAVSLDKH